MRNRFNFNPPAGRGAYCGIGSVVITHAPKVSRLTVKARQHRWLPALFLLKRRHRASAQRPKKPQPKPRKSRHTRACAAADRKSPAQPASAVSTDRIPFLTFRRRLFFCVMTLFCPPLRPAAPVCPDHRASAWRSFAVHTAGGSARPAYPESGRRPAGAAPPCP